MRWHVCSCIGMVSWAISPLIGAEPGIPAADKPSPSILSASGQAADQSVNILVDQYIATSLREQRLRPSARSSDMEYIRRVYLDIVGHIPPLEELESFLKSKDRNKRGNGNQKTHWHTPASVEFALAAFGFPAGGPNPLSMMNHALRRPPGESIGFEHVVEVVGPRGRCSGQGLFDSTGNIQKPDASGHERFHRYLIGGIKDSRCRPTGLQGLASERKRRKPRHIGCFES